MNTFEGALSAQEFSFGIVLSRFNSLVTEKLLTGAIDCLLRHGVKEKNISVARCPGAFEISQVAARLVASEEFDAIICLGCIVRGETPHFDYVASATTTGIVDLAEDSEIPVVFGVLTTETMEQAFDRAGGKSGNKGWDAALSAIEMANLFQHIPKKRTRTK
ncbi:MAG: 6,7-dimethyl-8-ribityllumazine synthase [Ignavibacteria bacterium]|nr:6,7-dimethyl-8-ribityllumazine synthase [Ignavibacteria bacterium]